MFHSKLPSIIFVVAYEDQGMGMDVNKQSHLVSNLDNERFMLHMLLTSFVICALPIT